MKFNYKYEVGRMFCADGKLNCTGEIIARVGRFNEPHYRCEIKTYTKNKDLVSIMEVTVSETYITESIEKATAKILKTMDVKENNTEKTMDTKKDNNEKTVNTEERKEDIRGIFSIPKLKETYKFCNNLSEKAYNNSLMPCFGRDKEIETIKYTLCRRTKPNILLLGKAGVGKTAIVEQFAQNCIDDYINGKTNRFTLVLELCLNSMLSGSKYRGDFEEKVENVITEIKSISSFDIVIFIDEIHGLNYIGNAEGATSIGQILKPALARGEIKVIGATTNSEYEKYLAYDKALCRRFNNIEVKELSGDLARNITSDILKDYSKYFEIETKVDIKSIYDRSIENLSGTFPDNFVNIIDETFAYASSNNIKEITTVDFDRTLDRYIIKDNKSKTIGFSKV